MGVDMTVIDLRTRQPLPEQTFERVSAIALECYRTSGMGAAWAVLKPAMMSLSERLRRLDVAAIKDYSTYMWMCGQFLDYVSEPDLFFEFQDQVGEDLKALSEYVEARKDVVLEETELLTMFCHSCRSLFETLALRYPGTP
jgi:hypothetical protein